MSGKILISGEGGGTNLQNLDETLQIGNSAGGHKIINLADPTAPQDAATKYYVDNHGSGATLKEVLDNGNVTDGYDIVVSTGDVITITDLPTADSDGVNKLYVDSLTQAGDLSGSVLAPTVVGLQGIPVDSTTPNNENVLTYNAGSNLWEPRDFGELISLSEVLSVGNTTDGYDIVVTAGDSIIFGTNPATTGTIRLAYNDTILARNVGNTGNIDVITIDTNFGADNTVTLGGVGANVVALDVASGGSHSLIDFRFDGSPVIRISSTVVTNTLPIDMGSHEITQLTYASFGASSVAASGYVRTPNNAIVVASRNVADSADISLLTVDTADCITLGHQNNASTIYYQVKTGSSHDFRVNNVSEYIFSATSANFNSNQILDPSYIKFPGLGTTSITDGYIRVPNNTTSLAARNAANSANVPLIRFLSDNALRLGDDTSTAAIYSKVATSGTHVLQVNNVSEYSFSSTIANFLDNILQFGTNPATTGLVRIPNNNVFAAARNAANSANIPLLTVDSSDGVILGDQTTAGTLYYQVKTGSNHDFRVNNVTEYLFTSTVADFTNNILQFGTSPATAGLIRIPNNQSIQGRNAANSGNISLLSLAASDVVTVGSTGVNELDLVSSNNIDFNPAGTLQFRFGSAGVTFFNALPIFDPGYIRFPGLGVGSISDGYIRAPNQTNIIVARNGTNTANLTLLRLDNVNKVFLGNNDVANTVLSAASGGTHQLRINNTVEYELSATIADFKDNVLLLTPQAEPAAPASGFYLYVDSTTGNLTAKSSAGNVTGLAPL